jgi:hypothetical protein
LSVLKIPLKVTNLTQGINTCHECSKPLSNHEFDCGKHPENIKPFFEHKNHKTKAVKPLLKAVSPDSAHKTQEKQKLIPQKRNKN